MEEELRQIQSRQESQRTEPESMAVEESSSLSSYHKAKLFLGFLKVLPMIMAGLYLSSTVLSFFNIESRAFSYLSSIGLIPWLFILAASYKLHFCEYHRMFLWYIMANNTICWGDEKYGLPVDNWNYFMLHITIVGVFMFLLLYWHQKCRRVTLE